MCWLYIVDWNYLKLKANSSSLTLIINPSTFSLDIAKLPTRKPSPRFYLTTNVTKLPGHFPGVSPWLKCCVIRIVWHRNQKSSGTFVCLNKRVFNNQKLSNRKKSNICYACVQFTLLYGGDTWTYPRWREQKSISSTYVAIIVHLR